MRKKIAVAILILLATTKAQAQMHLDLDVVRIPEKVLLQKDKDEERKNIIYYIELTTSANVRKAPVLLKEAVVRRARKGDIFPVFDIVYSRYGIFYRVGKNLYLHYSVAKVIDWL